MRNTKSHTETIRKFLPHDTELDLQRLIHQHATCDPMRKIRASCAGALTRCVEIFVSPHRHSAPGPTRSAGPKRCTRDMCQEFVTCSVSPIRLVMGYHQERGRAASVSEKTRPRVHARAQFDGVIQNLRRRRRGGAAKRLRQQHRDVLRRLRPPLALCVQLASLP